MSRNNINYHLIIFFSVTLRPLDSFVDGGKLPCALFQAHYCVETQPCLSCLIAKISYEKSKVPDKIQTHSDEGEG
jgi:hypothetical protein